MRVIGTFSVGSYQYKALQVIKGYDRRVVVAIV